MFPPEFCWSLATYCLLTTFQALMYFSMHWLKQVCSPLEREVPGLGTQRSKQCSLSFCGGGIALVDVREVRRAASVLK